MREFSITRRGKIAAAVVCPYNIAFGKTFFRY